jgi:cobalt-zinc-cadmium efflux system outer membrane protein
MSMTCSSMNAVLPLRHRIVEQTQLEYNAMQVGVFPLLQAKQAEIDAGREYVEALQQYWLQHVELERAAGGRLQQDSGPEGTNHDHTP